MTDTRTCPGSHSIADSAPALRNDEYLCRGCVNHAERILGDLPALCRELETTVSRQSKTGGNNKRATGHARPLPVNLTAADKGRDILALLFEWADHVATWHQVKGLPAFTRNRDLTELTAQATAILLYHSGWMRTAEQGPDLAHAIYCVRRDLRRLVDRTPERLYAGPCNADLGYPPELGYECRQSVFRKWGDGSIVCDGHTTNRKPGEITTTGCGTVHSEESRREWLRAEVESTLLPLRLVWESLYVLIPGCQIDWDTAKQWTRERRQRLTRFDGSGQPLTDKAGRELVRIHVTPPRLEPQGWTVTGQPLYRGSEILAVAEDKEARRGRRRTRRVNVA